MVASIVTVGRMDADDAEAVIKIFRAFDETGAPQIAGLRRRQVYTYCDLYIHVEDWDDTVAAGTGPAQDPRLAELDRELSPYLREYFPENWTGSDGSFGSDGPNASRFYVWPNDDLAGFEKLHCAVIVNSMQTSAIPEVSRLFAEFDATDVPQTMGTMRRQVLLFRGIYLHIQDFENKASKEVIGNAWEKADPRFLKIVADLTPIVPPYNPEGGQLATRVYHWAAA